MNYKELAEQFLKLLDEHSSVSIISHKRPDGDTIGSATALYSSLKLMGKQVELVCIDSHDLPRKLDFLNGFGKYKQKISYSDSLVVTVDCGDLGRCGLDLSGRRIVNIDHHKSNTYYGDLNIVEVEVSTTAVLFKLLQEGFAIDKNVAQSLYTGLITDSINFTTSLVNEHTFKLASDMISYGVDPSYVSQMVNKRESLAHTRLIAKAIDSMTLHIDGTVAVMTIEAEDLKATGARVSDIDGIVDFAVALVTVEIGVLIVELKNFYKVSLRSKNEDVSHIAESFGGGGHKNAAGFEVKEGKISEIKDEIIKRIKNNG